MKLNKTQRTKVTRTPDRASYDEELIHSIIDNSTVGHIAFKTESGTHSIPLAFWRSDDFIYCHCSSKSRLKELAETKQQVCISFAIVDGVVLAKSAFRHSLNYRSAVVYGQLELLTTDEEKLAAMKKFMDVVAEDRWESIRQPSAQELKATTVMRISLNESVAKVRKGPPVDKAVDKDLEVWTGVVPYVHNYAEPQACEEFYNPEED